MAKISVYYDQDLDALFPSWMVINFKRGEVDWDKEHVFIPTSAPFQRKRFEDFNEFEMSLSLTLNELIMNADKPHHFGIHLPSLKQRVTKIQEEEQMRFDINDITQFIIQICDIEEVMQMNLRRHYTWNRVKTPVL